MSETEHLSENNHRDDEAALSDSDNSSSGLFLGLVQQRYVRSLYGAIHGVTSLLSLMTGNWILIRRVLLGWTVSPSVLSVFFVCSITSAGVTILFYWNKVQSWQLSTTTMEEKGITAQQVQNINRGRGPIAIAAHTMFPLVLAFSPSEHLEDSMFSSAFASVMLILEAIIIVLVKNYSKTNILVRVRVILMYAGNHLGLAISILYHGSISKMIEAYPSVREIMENEAVFVISAVQFGFMWYYLYSRRLVSESLVKNMCKKYHPFVLSLWFFRTQNDRWWSSLPWPMLPRLALMTLPRIIFFAKTVMEALKRVTISVTHIKPKNE